MTIYELVIGITLLLLSMMLKSKSISLPAFYISFVILDSLNLGFIASGAISTNILLLIIILEQHYSRGNIDNVSNVNNIILKNKKMFPFNDNVIIAFSKVPYTYLYLKEGNVIRVRCSLKEMMSTPSKLKKINRNTAIYSEVKTKGKNRFIFKNQEITLDMMLTWHHHSHKEYNS